MGEPAPTRQENAAAFRDEDVVAAYRFRPPYPDALIRRLLALVPGGVRTVVELGCGTGELSRRLAPRVEHVDAVDPSTAMLRVAQASEGGTAANIRWTQALAEEFDYPGPYDLALAAESVHWMDPAAVMPRLARVMTPTGSLAVVMRSEQAPWSDAYRAIIPRFSVISDYRPVDPVTELEASGYWLLEGRETMAPILFRQSVDDYVELQHSRSAFARYRTGAERAAQFDRELRGVLAPYAHEGMVEYQAGVAFAWGRPNVRRVIG